MPEDNIKDFTINWVVIGLLVFSLIMFATIFMFNNNEGGLGDSFDKFNDTSAGLSTRLIQTSDSGNDILNVTANTNPEASELGSRDSVSTAFGFKNAGTGMFETMKDFFAWVLIGDAGKMLLSIFGGLIVFLIAYFIYKFVRTGF